jgi:hypothetical protein
MLAVLLSLLLPCVAGDTVALAEPVDTGNPEPQIIIRRSGEGDDEKKGTIMLRAMPQGQTPDSPEGRVLVLQGDEEGLPKVWIGVRITPVPGPLAAHIGESGVMISNVVVSSPADEAGLQQYDVVVRCGDQELEGPKDLTTAVGKAEAGQKVKLVLVRKGGQQTITVRPVERPADLKYELKYDEPEEALIESGTKMRGLKLMRPGPEGEWLIKELGPMLDLPDALEELEHFDIDIDADELFDFDVGKGAKVEVKVRVEADGQTTVIHRDADGKIHVTHTDADGNESSATYDSPEEFKEADPEGFKLYGRHGGHPGRAFIHIRPSLEGVRKLQKEFQVDVQKKVKEALKRSGEGKTLRLQGSAGAKGAALGKGGARIMTGSGQGLAIAAGSAPSLGLHLSDGGGIMIFVRGEDGKMKTYKFENKEEFKANEPKLYEKFKNLFE